MLATLNSSDSRSQKPENHDETKVPRELPDLNGFSPSSCDPGPKIDQRQMGDNLGTFESCQSELIDLQMQFKQDMLSLDEVEGKFEAWKRKHESNSLAKTKRAEELETMRDEWLTVQQG